MFVIIGILIVFGAVIGGYMMEHGHIKVLLQPAELVIIAGAALGTLLVANPLHLLKEILGGIVSTLRGSAFTKKRYLELLKMMYDLFNKARREGLIALESDVEEPDKSLIFTAYPQFVKDTPARDFVCDTLRMSVSGGVEAFDMDQMMEADMDVKQHEAQQPVAALSTVADSLPGLGIVAAVLGVVVTMGSLGGPPEEIGHKVAAALVGTFLGILLCYGMIGPVAANMGKLADEQRAYYHVIRTLITACNKGLAPSLAVEVGRRAVPEHVRPSFKEVEDACRGGSASASASSATAPAAD
jgi:chemotaxis protein MotA